MTICPNCFSVSPDLCSFGPVSPSGQLSLSDGVGGTLGSGDQNLDPCASKLPNYCNYVEPTAESSCNCNSECEGQRDALFAVMTACRQGMDPAGGTCVGTSGGCIEADNGGSGTTISLCEACNDDGDCERWSEAAPSSDVGLGDKDLGPWGAAGTWGYCAPGDSSCDETDSNSSHDGKPSSDERDNASNVDNQDATTKTPTSPTPTDAGKKNDPSSADRARSGQAEHDGTATHSTDTSNGASDERGDGHTSNTPASKVTRNPTEKDKDEQKKGTPGDDGGGDDGDNDDTTDTDGDPVSLATGSTAMAQTDISVAGPVVNLDFTRFYDSRSGDRSILGSNWTTNFDFRLTVLKPENAPAWASRYCVVASPLASCVMLHKPDGETRLFVRDTASRLFVPMAGSNETIEFRPDGWILTRPDRSYMLFDPEGYLVEARDRHGNGYHVDEEPTDLFLLYRRYCSRGPQHNFSGQGESFDKRLCTVLGYMFDDRVAPDLGSEGWQPYRDLGSFSIGEIGLPQDDFDPTPTASELEILPDDISNGVYQARLFDARTEFERVAARGALPEAVTGSRRMRPVRVVDDLGREFDFHYFTNPNDDRAGLLASIGLSARELSVQ